MHKHTHTRTHAHNHAHTLTHTYTHTHNCKQTQHTHRCTSTHTAHTQHTHTHSTHTHTHKTHTHTHTHKHTYTRTHTHMHTLISIHLQTKQTQITAFIFVSVIPVKAGYSRTFEKLTLSCACCAPLSGAGMDALEVSGNVADGLRGLRRCGHSRPVGNVSYVYVVVSCVCMCVCVCVWVLAWICICSLVSGSVLIFVGVDGPWLHACISSVANLKCCMYLISAHQICLLQMFCGSTELLFAMHNLIPTTICTYAFPGPFLQTPLPAWQSCNAAAKKRGPLFKIPAWKSCNSEWKVCSLYTPPNSGLAHFHIQPWHSHLQSTCWTSDDVNK
jgi:hypothetical protein